MEKKTKTDLYTPMTEVKSRGFPGTRLVKMNSNLEKYENLQIQSVVASHFTCLVWLHLVSR